MKPIDRHRPIPFYFITSAKEEDISFDAMLRSLSVLKRQGFGGAILFNKPPHGFQKEEYLGEKWFRMIRNAIRAGIELQLQIWVNDGFDYPPGDAGGRVRALNPDLKQQRLLLQDDRVIAQEVEWGFPAFEEPESSELFIRLVYEAYREQVGEYFGKGLTGIFSDADNRRVSAEMIALAPTGQGYFPWSKGFRDSFQESYGYDISPYLRDILKRRPSPQGQDYWKHASMLYRRWFFNNHRWCRENGLLYTFHTSDTSPFSFSEMFRTSVFSEGSALEMGENSDFPGTDQELLECNSGKHYKPSMLYVPRMSWGGGSEGRRSDSFYSVYGDLRAKQAASCAFLNRKKGAMCEMFAASNWGATFEELRCIAAYQIMQGITFIVPHAYHHRLLGNTKYFAPPDFSEKSYLSYGIKAFNDTIARYAALADEGELIAPVAVLDITRWQWNSQADSSVLFDICQQLNRLPYGYVIARPEDIRDNRERFSAVVNPGLELDDGSKAILQDTCLPVVTDVKSLEQLIPCDVSYHGEGAPHFMRRRLEDGGELILLANIEDGREIRGELEMGGSAYPLALMPGEIAFFHKDWQDYRKPAEYECKTPLPSEMEVVWEKENILPLEWWKNDSGQTVTKSGEDSALCFPFQTEAELPGIRLLVSARHSCKVDSIFCDGAALALSGRTKVLDDDYLVYGLPCLETGRHAIRLTKKGGLETEDPILLTGEFDLSLQTWEPFYRQCAVQYNQKRYIPKEAEAVLSNRTRRLDTGKSFTEQGHPFYSGKVTYHTEISIPRDGEVLLFPEIGNACRVTLNGTELGKRIWRPYLFDLKGHRGVCRLEIEVSNTFANRLEYYRAPSGILKGGGIYSLLSR